MELYEKVVLITDKFLESDNLGKGAIGYVIEKYDNSFFEIEFSDSKTGNSIPQVVLNKSDIRLEPSN